MKQFVNKFKAGYPGLYIVSPELERVKQGLIAAAAEAGRSLYFWRIGLGLVPQDGKPPEESPPIPAPDPGAVLEAVVTLPEKAVVVLPDFHLLLAGSDAMLFASVRDCLRHCESSLKTLVIVAARHQLPPELARDWTTMDFPLPTADDLKQIAAGIVASSADVTAPPDVDAFAAAGKGLTFTEAQNAIAEALLDPAPTPDKLGRIKAEALAQGGLVEIVKTPATPDDIGGLDILKGWVAKRRDAFTQEARDAGLPMPKGILICGIPGTGKSLTAKAGGSILGLPVLRLDCGKMMGSLVGQSENNMREALKVAESMSPCVLWIDEIEKGMSGGASSGQTDGGTTSRVISTFLTWMQDRTNPVFVVATANDITKLPPEFMRKGRFDELFFVDLPNMEDRKAIFKIHVEKNRRGLKAADYDALAGESEGYTGAEIEAAVHEAMFTAFADNRRKLTAADIKTALTSQVPLSRTMGEQLSALSKWATGRCRPASSRQVPGKDAQNCGVRKIG